MFILLLYLYFALAETNAHDYVFGPELYEVLNVDEKPGYTRYPLNHKDCKFFDQSQKSAYVVILLYKTSGRFLGMGGIIDSRTVITAEEVVKVGFRNPQDLLVMAGYLSPWWGKNAQVRNCYQMISNEYELVLMEVRPGWKFESRILPIDLKTKGVPDDAYLADFLVYGIPRTSEFVPGDGMTKGASYKMAKHSFSKENNCGKNYRDLKPEFNKSLHQCLYPNGSFCTGCLGSPVVGMRKKSLMKDLVGIVVRSSCVLETHDVLMVGVSTFSNWIKFNGFLV